MEQQRYTSPDFNDNFVSGEFPYVSFPARGASQGPLGPGCLLDGYRLTSLLGKGGAGQVFRARSIRLRDMGHVVAIKVSKDRIPGQGDHIDLMTEARLTAGVRHPAIVDVYRSGRVDGYLYSVMEWVEGWTLRDMIRQMGPLPVSVCVDIGLQLCDALAYLHGRHLIPCKRPMFHCDLKPSNIMVSVFGEVKLIDFGVARPIDSPIDPDAKVYGTPAYMAPEQVMNRPITPATDVFGLGVVLYELATGQRMFKENNIPKLLRDRMASLEEPNIGRLLEPTGSRLFGRILARCTDPRPERRYANTVKLARTLRLFKQYERSGPELRRFLSDQMGSICL